MLRAREKRINNRLGMVRKIIILNTRPCLSLSHHPKMPFGSKIFDKQLDESQWWTDCHFVPGAPPPVTQKLCVCVWLLLPVFVLFSLAAWLTGWIRANFTDIYIQRNIKHIKDFFFVFPLAASRVQSTLSSCKWDTDPVF